MSWINSIKELWCKAGPISLSRKPTTISGRSAMTPPNLRHFYIILYIISLKAQPICPTSDMPVPIGQKLWETFDHVRGIFFYTSMYTLHLSWILIFSFFFYFEPFRAFAAKKQHFFLKHFFTFQVQLSSF